MLWPTKSIAVTHWHKRLLVLATLLVACIPAIWLARTVAHYSVEMPSQDDWEMVPSIVKAHTGELTIGDLFAQQEEARTFVPKLISILSAMDGRWDVRDEMMFSVALCALTAAGIYLLLLRSGLGLVAAALCFWASELLIFSPAHFELWLLASGFPSFMPALCLVAALLALETEWPVRNKFVICALLSAVSTFTLAHGLLAWALTFPVYLLSQRVPKAKWWSLAWAVATFSSAALYFYDYKKPAQLPDFAPAVAALDYLQFFLAFIGGGLAYASKNRSLELATAVGAVVAALFVCQAAYVLARWRDRDGRRRALPWIALGLYSFGSAALATLGRIGFGVQYAISSRYVTFSLYATVAVLVLGALLSAELVHRRRSRSTFIAVGASWLLVGFLGFELYRVSFVRTLGFLHSFSARNRLAHSALLLSPVIDTSALIQLFIYHAPDVAKARALALDDLHLLQPPLIRNADIGKFTDNAPERRAAAGECEIFDVDDEGVAQASGWAVLNGKRRPADAVVLAYETPEGSWKAFALTDQIFRRRDIARRVQQENALGIGWTAKFQQTAVPPGARISAWALDAEIPKLYRLEQDQRLHF